MDARRRPGEIRDAIVTYLRDCQRDASIDEISHGVSRAVLAVPPASSIRSYLRLNTPDMFLRTAPGRYRLRITPPADPVPAPRSSTACSKVFSHGKAILFNGDCISWLANREPNSIHGVVTDPPYGLVEYSSREQTKLRGGRGGVWRIPPSFDGHQRSPLPRFTTLDRNDRVLLHEFFLNWGRALFPVLVPGGHLMVASNPLVSFIVSHALDQAGFERRGEVIRLVMTMRGGDRPKNAHVEFSGVSMMPRSMWEPWLLFRKPLEGRAQDNLRKWKTGGLRRPSASKPFGDVIRSNPTQKRERRIAPHPSLKPQAFLREIVRAILPLAEGVVLDPFAGSGSTLAACENQGYQSVGIELDPHYVEIAKSAIPRLATLHA